MLTPDTAHGTNIVTVTHDGSLGTGEIVAAREPVATVASAGTTGVRVLPDVREIDPGHVEPSAALTGPTVSEGAMTVADRITSTDARVFEPGQRDQAAVRLQS